LGEQSIVGVLYQKPLPVYREQRQVAEIENLLNLDASFHRTATSIIQRVKCAAEAVVVRRAIRPCTYLDGAERP